MKLKYARTLSDKEKGWITKAIKSRRLGGYRIEFDQVGLYFDRKFLYIIRSDADDIVNNEITFKEVIRLELHHRPIDLTQKLDSDEISLLKKIFNFSSISDECR